MFYEIESINSKRDKENGKYRNSKIYGNAPRGVLGAGGGVKKKGSGAIAMAMRVLGILGWSPAARGLQVVSDCARASRSPAGSRCTSPEESLSSPEKPRKPVKPSLLCGDSIILLALRIEHNYVRSGRVHLCSPLSKLIRPEDTATDVSRFAWLKFSRVTLNILISIRKLNMVLL